MRRNQFHLKNYTKEKENIKIKMNKKCLECGHVFYFDFEIIFHECDPAKIIETKSS